MLWEWRGRDACAVEMEMLFYYNIMEYSGVPQRITQHNVTVPSHFWMSRKRSRFDEGKQERREKKRHEIWRGQRVKGVREKGESVLG